MAPTTRSSGRRVPLAVLHEPSPPPSFAKAAVDGLQKPPSTTSTGAHGAPSTSASAGASPTAVTRAGRPARATRSSDSVGGGSSIRLDGKSPHPLSLPHRLARSTSCTSTTSSSGLQNTPTAAASVDSRLRGSPPAHESPKTTIQPPTSSPARNLRSSPPLLRRIKATAVGSPGLSSGSTLSLQAPRTLRSRLASSGGAEHSSPQSRGGNGNSSNLGRSIDPAFFSYEPSPCSAVNSSQANIVRQQQHQQRQQILAQTGLSGSNGGGGGGEDGTAGCGFEVYSDRPSTAILLALRRRAAPSSEPRSRSREREQPHRLSVGSAAASQMEGSGNVVDVADDDADVAKENIPVPRQASSPPDAAAVVSLESTSSSGLSVGAAALKRRRSASSNLSLCSTSSSTAATAAGRNPPASHTVGTRASKVKVGLSSMPVSSEAAVEEALACRSSSNSSPSGGASHCDGEDASVVGAIATDDVQRAATSSSPVKRPTTPATIASLEMPPPALLRFGPPSIGPSSRAARAVSSPRHGERSSPRHRKPTVVEGVFT